MTAINLVYMRCVLISHVGSSEQNVDAITTEAIRVKTGAVGYTRFNTFW